MVKPDLGAWAGLPKLTLVRKHERQYTATAVPANVQTYDMMPAGKQFIGVVPAGQTRSGTPGGREIQVVLNWFEDVKQRASGK